VVAKWTPAGPSGAPGYELVVDGSAAGKAELKFTSLAPSVQLSSYDGDEQRERQEKAGRVLKRAAGLVDAMGLHFQWLGSLRRYPPRYGRYVGAPPLRLGSDG